MRGGLLQRSCELAALERQLQQVRAGAGRVIVVEGPAGVGKSSLLRAVAQSASGAGVRVLRAWAGPLEREAGWGVVRQLFGPTAAGPEWEHLGVGAAALARRVLDPDPFAPAPDRRCRARCVVRAELARLRAGRARAHAAGGRRRALGGRAVAALAGPAEPAAADLRLGRAVRRAVGGAADGAGDAGRADGGRAGATGATATAGAGRGRDAGGRAAAGADPAFAPPATPPAPATRSCSARSSTR